jgi:rhamnosyltransferase
VTDDVAAVVTAFRPGDRLVALVVSLLPQVGRVVVVDDGSGPGYEAVLDAVRAAGARVVQHETNRGIAAALNTGIAEARRASTSADATTSTSPSTETSTETTHTDTSSSTHTDTDTDTDTRFDAETAGGPTPAPAYLLTVDQDSEIGPGFVAALVGTAQDAAAAGLRVGLVAPVHVEGLPSPVTGYTRGFMLGGTPIQSGMLVPASTVDTVGRFAEPLFIDGVDTDFALRVARQGLQIALAPGASLGHSLGDRHTPAVLGHPLAVAGRPVSLVVSKPFRYYYLVRNRILLNRMHVRGNRAWCVRETLTDLRHCAIVLVAVPGRRARLAAMVAGLRDGWAGRSGRIPAALAQRVAGR